MAFLRKNIGFSFLFLFLFFLNAEANPNVRFKYNFNSDWKMQVGDFDSAKNPEFDDSGWKQVCLPHAFNEDDAFRVAINQLSTGIVWYRKRFKLPVSSVDKKVFLEFEGIRQGGEFYLNGEFIGRHENGVMAFGFDISDKVKFNDENVLAVRIDNSWDYKEKSTNTTFQWNHSSFNANYGGITKNVYLHLTGKLYQTLPLYSFLKSGGIYIYARNIDIQNKTALINVESEVRNDSESAQVFQLEIELFDADGKSVKRFKGKQIKVASGNTVIAKAFAKIDNLNFWSWGYGYLYSVRSRLMVDKIAVDEITTITGFRKTEFTNGEIKLNDRVLQIKGYAQRSTNEWPALGMSVPAWVSDFSNKIMLESNANLVRWMHITPWKQDIESCDRIGLPEVMPAGDSEKDAANRQWEQRKELMRDAIIYNRNNPSIIFYEAGNKGISEAHMQEMKDIRNQYDPYGGRAIGARDMLDSKIAEYGGEMLYIDKSANIPLWQMEYSRDEGLRKYWDEFTYPFHSDGDGPQYRGQDASRYNRNQDSHAIENIIRWYDYWLARPGTGKRVNSGGVKIIFSDSNTHSRGAENYRRSGVVDAMRLYKDGYYANQVMWDGWVDIENPHTYIIGHWNYSEGTIKDINIVSSGEKVELFVNNRSLGFGKQICQFLFTFKDVHFEPGKIRAVSYNNEGIIQSETSKITAGIAESIRLTLHQHPQGMRADGADIVLVDVDVMDSEGNRCPTAFDTISFSLSGPAEWRGGIAQGPENYILAKRLPVECGINRVIIRSLPESGDIELRATSPGLNDASIKFSSNPVQREYGLSSIMPNEALKSVYTRGPASLTQSYIQSRIPLQIKSITAGSNQDIVQNTIDDNETTDWFNDGDITTAWIEYELEDISPISEIEMKLNNFRTRSYPIKITIDGEEVMNDISKRGLGYTVFRLNKQCEGRRVRVSLLDTKDPELLGDVFGEMKELGGRKLDDGVARNDIKALNRLSIIELEVYK